jgi:hypothetical protein
VFAVVDVEIGLRTVRRSILARVRVSGSLRHGSLTAAAAAAAEEEEEEEEEEAAAATEALLEDETKTDCIDILHVSSVYIHTYTYSTQKKKMKEGRWSFTNPHI